ncbi:hypothetical protein OG379_35010 [Streptomyces sp. NBC_01166]|uniref:hypothetical protein n=1 Tax=Streptomyces sp. NBC_01166 TaxID=2903755 RepID=UPI00386BFA9F|nr:hypothetical protein OG379_35010 [Streptomyces sp. NBC_01166]
MTADRYKGWDSETRFQSLLDELIPLDMGSWLLPEVRAALATLGWQLLPVSPGQHPPDPARGRRPEVAWTLGRPPEGPRQGVGVLTVASGDPRQVLGLEVNLTYGIAYDDDHSSEWHFAQTARELTERALGGPPTWLAGPGPRAVWHRPGVSVAVMLDEGCVVLQLLRTAHGTESRPGQPDVWRGSTPARPCAPEAPQPVRNWTDAQARLSGVMQALCAQVPTLPGSFTLHLSSARDPLRFVSAWNEEEDLRVEAFTHFADLADPERLTRLGWRRHGGLWQRRFRGAQKRGEHAREATALLVDALITLEVDTSELVYFGELSTPRGLRHLELPYVGVPRAAPEEATPAGA